MTARVYLHRKVKPRIEQGHPWVYQNEIDRVEGRYKPGDIVEVYNHKGRFIGRGYINPKSLITVRIMSRNEDEPIDEGFFWRRLERAWLYRQRLVDTSSCRVVFAEADGLPGLIVDKFNDYLSIQTLTFGIEQYKDLIADLLMEIVGAKGIYERNDQAVRETEGLAQTKGFLRGEFQPYTVITENGIKMGVDIARGQKTGYFLDQRENRNAIRQLVQNAQVLDCFSHTGSFALHALHFGAKHATVVDISDEALAVARENAELNDAVGAMDFVCANAFDLLRQYDKDGRQFDVVILDPPAFTKSARTVDRAYRGYKEINLRGMKLTKPGGFLVTASCSQHMTPDLFRQVLVDAALDAKVTIREVEYRTQAKDHPYLWSFPESLYLKFFILEVNR